MLRKSGIRTVIMAIYVDDCLIIADKAEVVKAIEEIKNHSEVTHSADIEEFVGCTIEKENGRILLSQPDLINKLL